MKTQDIMEFIISIILVYVIIWSAYNVPFIRNIVIRNGKETAAV